MKSHCTNADQGGLDGGHGGLFRRPNDVYSRQCLRHQGLNRIAGQPHRGISTGASMPLCPAGIVSEAHGGV